MGSKPEHISPGILFSTLQYMPRNIRETFFLERKSTTRILSEKRKRRLVSQSDLFDDSFDCSNCWTLEKERDGFDFSSFQR